jgi:NAD+ synthase
MLDIDLTINTDLARGILTGFIRSELNRVGYSKAVINLSGGLDSALSCFLAAEALGPQNVLAIRLPYRSSAQDSLDDAQKVIDATGVQAMTFEITGMVDPLIGAFPEMSNTRKGNIMARARMIVLYDQSEAFHGLAVGTGNKTEILLGYTTLYGDSACAINPIGDLYKTQVRQLSRALGVPASILDKAPSADLWSGQTDECWSTSAIRRRKRWRPASPSPSSPPWSSASAATTSSASCRPSPSSPTAPSAMTFCICATGEHEEIAISCWLLAVSRSPIAKS